MDLLLLRVDSNEWNYMWEWLDSHPLNSGLNEPKEALNNEEVWQYVGSYRQGKKTIHELRHRSFPKTNSLVYLNLHASKSFSDDDIDKVYKIPSR